MSLRFSIEKLKQGLSKTKKSLLGKITEVVGLSKKIDQELLDKLEEVLLKGDVGVQATEKIIKDLKNRGASEDSRYNKGRNLSHFAEFSNFN